MNSICIPRLAGEAAGAIARLEHKTDPEKVRTLTNCVVCICLFARWCLFHGYLLAILFTQAILPF